MKILITGGTGFVGSKTVSACLCRGNIVSATRRNPQKQFQSGVIPIQIKDIGPDTIWREYLEGKECVIHTAARAHIMNDTVNNPIAAYQRINTEGTLNLAKQAAQSGIRRFIFISSIKVNGESTKKGESFHPDDVPLAKDPYGISKLKAEFGLREIADASGMEIVIIRPTMVYGPGVKGNFLSMLHWIDKRIPLPLGGINNKRSMVALDNLVDLILKCVDNPLAANQIFLASDGEDISTSELLRLIGNALDRPARLFSLPQEFVEACGRLVGMSAQVRRLYNSLQVDIEKNKKLLNWTPPITMLQGLHKTVEFYKSQKLKNQR